MKKLSVAFIFSLSVLIAMGQGSGYCGGHFMVSYNVNAGIPLDNIYNSTTNNLQLYLYAIQKVNVDYLIGRSAVLGLEYDFQRQGVNADTNTINDPVKQYYLRTSANIYQLHALFFLHHGIAPIGPYFKLSAGAGNETMSAGLPVPYSTNPVPGAVKYQIYTFTLGWGKERILLNHITYNYGIDFNFYLDNAMQAGELPQTESVYALNNKFILSYHLDIGGLLF